MIDFILTFCLITLSKKINLEIFSSAQKSKTIHFCDNFQISLHAVITCTVIYLYNYIYIKLYARILSLVVMAVLQLLS